MVSDLQQVWKTHHLNPCGIYYQAFPTRTVIIMSRMQNSTPTDTILKFMYKFLYSISAYCLENGKRREYLLLPLLGRLLTPTT
jgi:hypothetical protein